MKQFILNYISNDYSIIPCSKFFYLKSNHSTKNKNYILYKDVIFKSVYVQSFHFVWHGYKSTLALRNITIHKDSKTRREKLKTLLQDTQSLSLLRKFTTCELCDDCFCKVLATFPLCKASFSKNLPHILLVTSTFNRL